MVHARVLNTGSELPGFPEFASPQGMAKLQPIDPRERRLASIVQLTTLRAVGEIARRILSTVIATEPGNVPAERRETRPDEHGRTGADFLFDARQQRRVHVLGEIRLELISEVHVVLLLKTVKETLIRFISGDIEPRA